jgi:hypothetical protein
LGRSHSKGMLLGMYILSPTIHTAVSTSLCNT